MRNPSGQFVGSASSLLAGLVLLTAAHTTVASAQSIDPPGFGPISVKGTQVVRLNVVCFDHTVGYDAPAPCRGEVMFHDAAGKELKRASYDLAGYPSDYLATWRANLSAVAAIGITMGAASYIMGSTLQTGWLAFTLLAWGYVVGYLGVSRLSILVLRRLARIPELMSIIITGIIASGGIAIPLAFEASARGLARFDYSELQVTNWAWSLEQCGRMNLLDSHPMVVFMTISFALLMLAVNSLFCNRELAPVRTGD